MSLNWKEYADTPQEFLIKLNKAKYTPAKPNKKGIVGTFVFKLSVVE